VDIGQQVQATLTEAARASLCLRDEEAAGSNPATPDQLSSHVTTIAPV
jgi:hypothetical protein